MRGTGAYPTEWTTIAKAIKDDAHWRCVRCGHEHDRTTGHVLTVHHLDGKKDNCRWWNCPALCQRCHLSIQGRVLMERPWVMEHTAWFKPYAAGYYAWTYLGLDLSREEVMADIDELLGLEAFFILGREPWSIE